MARRKKEEAAQVGAEAAKASKNKPWNTRTAPPMQALNEQLAVTVEDAAALLQLGRQTAYDAVKNGKIPHIRIGSRIRVPSAALRALMEKLEPTEVVAAE